MKPGVGQRALAIAAFGLVAATAAPAAADTASEIRALKARLLQLEAQVAKQRHEAAHHGNVANAGHGDHGPVVKVAPPAHAPPPPVFVSFKNGLFVETEDKAFSFGVNGRVHVDGGVQSDPRLGDASNVLLRRARLDIAGKAFKHWYYRTQFEFGAGNANVRDAWGGFKYPILAGLGYDKDLFIQFGNHLRPLGLEAMSTSNSGITFIERTMMSDTFNTPRRHIGLSVTAGEHNWGAKFGIYSTSPQDAALRPNRAGLGQYYEFAGRAVYLPIRTEEDLIHIGASGRYRNAGGTNAASDDELLFARGHRGEVNVLNQGFRPTGTMDLSCNPGVIGLSAANQILLHTNAINQNGCLNAQYGFNIEGLAVHGPFSLQAEYARSYYDFDAGVSAALIASSPTTRLAAGQGVRSSASFDGWYAQAAWFITGETRITGYTDLDHNVNTPYTFSTQPKILNPISKGGYGAFEVAARWSALNANSGSTGPWSYYAFLGGFSNNALLAANSAGIAGGRMSRLTLGFNWYPEKGYRFLFNWSKVMEYSAPWNAPYLAGLNSSSFLTRAEVWW